MDLPAGVLEYTHVRFFTRKEAKKSDGCSKETSVNILVEGPRWMGQWSEIVCRFLHESRPSRAPSLP